MPENSSSRQRDRRSTRLRDRRRARELVAAPESLSPNQRACRRTREFAAEPESSAPRHGACRRTRELIDAPESLSRSLAGSSPSQSEESSPHQLYRGFIAASENSLPHLRVRCQCLSLHKRAHREVAAALESSLPRQVAEWSRELVVRRISLRFRFRTRGLVEAPEDLAITPEELIAAQEASSPHNRARRGAVQEGSSPDKRLGVGQRKRAHHWAAESSSLHKRARCEAVQEGSSQHKRARRCTQEARH